MHWFQGKIVVDRSCSYIKNGKRNDNEAHDGMKSRVNIIGLKPQTQYH